jgi:hypothetical protein
MSGNGPSIDAGGSVTFVSSGTPSKLSMRFVRSPLQNCTPCTREQGMRPRRPTRSSRHGAGRLPGAVPEQGHGNEA